jgi:hypothetical protein
VHSEAHPLLWGDGFSGTGAGFYGLGTKAKYAVPGGRLKILRSLCEPEIFLKGVHCKKNEMVLKNSGSVRTNKYHEGTGPCRAGIPGILCSDNLFCMEPGPDLLGKVFSNLI